MHLVDLDGAFEGRPVNAEAISTIARNHPGLTIQLGGGIRSAETIEAYLEAGVDLLIIGTMAVEQPEFVSEMCRKFPGHIIVGLDGLHGMVAKNGWKEVTEISVNPSISNSFSTISPLPIFTSPPSEQEFSHTPFIHELEQLIPEPAVI